jgi:hypothetical protein
MQAPFVFSSIQLYPSNCSLFYLKFMWGGSSPNSSVSMPHFSCHWKLLPLQAHWRCGSTPAFSSQCVYLQFAWGLLLPTLRWHIPHFSCCYKLSPLQGCWVSATNPAFSGWLVYLQFTWGSAPPLLSRAQGALPSLLHVFSFSAACLLFSLFFSLFTLGGGQSVQGLCWFVPRLSVGVPHAA